MLLSSSRIYLFEVTYKKKNWLSVLDANNLSGMIANILTNDIEELRFKNIEIVNNYKGGFYSCEVHINKLKYKNRRTLVKSDVTKLRLDLVKQLKKINDFEFKQIHIVNDEFSKIPSTGFLTEDALYV